ncbi:MAG: hypothetical protein D6743_05750 [Calditrichaeota bacterium]|nr:MAG: hypothetical protein D6743_05750 [Calditrichota bacterium]
MNVKDISGVGLPRRIEKQSVDDVREKKIQKKESDKSASVGKTDQIEISQEAKALQSSPDEIVLSKELLSKLPSTRAHIIYEALAKIKAGLYSSDEIVEEAASKLLESGDLDDVIRF